VDEFLNPEKEQKVLQCFYCGNKTKMDMVGQHINHWETDDGSFRGYNKHKMFICPVRERVTFHYAYWEDGMYDRNGQGYEEDEILYPINSIDSKAMPTEIKDAFEAALKIRNIDNAVCLMALRRTLELICHDKGASEKKKLAGKIEELAQQGILPEPLKDASSFTRELGNSAAHDNKLNVGSHDIDSIVDFVKYIIEYLYILPYKLKRYKK